jgi:hypothetical protein
LTESHVDSINSTFHPEIAGILLVLDSTVQKTVDILGLSHRYENHVKSLSDHQFEFFMLPIHVHKINHPLHTYQGERCFTTNSHLSSADIDV